MSPTFTPGIGKLTLDRYDAQNHFTGAAFRHLADQIDLNSPITIGSQSYSQVNSAIGAITSILNLSNIYIQGIVTVGDGYDTFHNDLSSPNAPYDSSIPGLDIVLNDVLTNPNNPAYSRIQDGGVILVKSGTYVIKNTVSIPPGTIIMGEGFGTKIVNKVSGAPIFKIKSDASKKFGSTSANLVDNSPDAAYKFMVTRETRLMNLIIADNFVEPTVLGDSTYLTPQNTYAIASDANRGLVSVEEGANFTADGVKFLGRVSYSVSGVTISTNGITAHAINTDSTTPSTSGTVIQVRNCVLDCFATPIKFTASGNTNDYLKVMNSYIRGYGFCNNSNTNINSSMIKVNSCNTTVEGNYCYGALVGVSSLVYVASDPGSPALQSYPKITVAANNIAINKGSSSSNNTFTTLLIDSSITSPYNFLTMIHGNNWEGVFEVSFNGGLNDFTLSKSSSGTVSLGFGANNAVINSSNLQFSASGSITIGGLQLNINTPTVVNSSTATHGIMNFKQSDYIAYNSSTVNVDVGLATVDSTNNIIIGRTLNGTQISTGFVKTNYPIIGDDATTNPLSFGLTSMSLTGLSGTQTLTASQYNRQVLEFTGTLSNNVNIALPNVSNYTKLIHNNTITDGFELTVSVGSSTVYVPSGQKRWVHYDGSGLYILNHSRYMPIGSNAILNYKLSEAAGSSTVASSGSNTEAMAVNLASSLASLGMIGIFDRCVYFPGGSTRDYIGNVTTAVSLSYPMRVSIWFLPTAIPASSSSLICGKLIDASSGAYNTPFLTYSMSLTTNGVVSFYVGSSSGGGSITVTTSRPVRVNDWNHIGFTYDQPTGTFKYYLNGVLEGTNTALGAGFNMLSTGGPWFIGANPNANSGTPAQSSFFADEYRIEMGSSTLIAGAATWFADVYRLGIGRHDDIGT